MSSVDKARARAERLLYSLGIGEVASCRVEELREAIQSGDRNRIVQACNMVDTAKFLLKSSESVQYA